MTLEELFQSYIYKKKLAGLSEATVWDYKHHLKGFFAFVGGSLPVSALTLEQVEAYVRSLLATKRLSRATVATYVRNVRIFLNYADRQGLLSFSPYDIKIPKSPKTNPLIYSDAEIKQIFASISSPVRWLYLRNSSFIALMLDSGLRQGEVAALLVNDVSFDDSRILVHGKGGKDRFVPLGAFSSRVLRLYMDACPYPLEDSMFLEHDGSPLSKNAIRLTVRRLAKKLPFPLSSHKLRHNFATNYCLDKIEQDGQVDAFTLKMLMGHSEISTTERYIHCAMELLAVKSTISHLDRLFADMPI